MFSKKRKARPCCPIGCSVIIRIVKKIIRKIGRKLVLWVLVPLIGVGIYIFFSDTSLQNLSYSLGIDSIAEKLRFSTAITRVYTPEEIIVSGEKLIGRRVKLRGIVHLYFNSPDSQQTSLYVGPLFLGVPSTQRTTWTRALNQVKEIEGIVQLRNSELNGSQYFLDEPKLLD